MDGERQGHARWGSRQVTSEPGTTEVVVVGAGIAGSAAAAVLAADGIDVALIDSRAAQPHRFKAEIMGTEHVGILARLGLLEAVRAVGTRIRLEAEAWRGMLLRQSRTEHYALPFATLVNTVRAEIPSQVNFRCGKVVDIVPGTELARVELDDGGSLHGRLVIVAAGSSGRLFKRLGINKRIVSRAHSITFGANIRPEIGRTFEFDELTYWGDDESQLMLTTFFPLGASWRLNTVAHWVSGDGRIAEFLADPARALHCLQPEMCRITGRFDVVGHPEASPVHLHVLEGHLLPGVVFIGDAHSVACPGVGTGVAKALSDVDILCRSHVPQWLQTPGMGIGKIARFYGDRRKLHRDKLIHDMSISTRRTAVDRSMLWEARRKARTLRRHMLAAAGWLRPWQPPGEAGTIVTAEPTDCGVNS